MTERRKMWEPLFFAVSLCAALTLNIPDAMARGGGGGRHCGGGGGHVSCGGGHFGGGGGHISTGHSFSSCGTHSSSFGGHAFLFSGSHASRVNAIEHQAGIRTLEQCSSNSHLQEVASQPGPASSYCSSVVRSEPHAGLFGHIHRFFADKPCDLQNIHTEIMPRMLTEITCEQAPRANFTHQIFSQENLALNEVAAKTSYLHANALRYRCLDQTNRNFVANQNVESYFNVNINNKAYPANDLNLALENEDADSIVTEIVESDTPPTFSGLSYMLPNPGGILSIYFSYETTINNFLLLQKSSFLAVAMHQSL